MKMGMNHRACVEPSRNEQRRRQVLEGAAECFCRHGFHSASMAEIARKAGMSVGHIYHYFENKEAIIAAIVQNNQAQVLATMDMIESSARPLPDALIETVAVGVDQCIDVAASGLMLEVLAEAARNPKVAAVVHESDAVLRARMRDMLRKAKSGAETGDERLDGQVETLFTLFQGISIRAIRNPSLNRDRMVTTMQGAIRWVLAS